MKHKIAVCFAFLSTLPFLCFGQQSEAATRQLTPQQQLDIQRGEIEYFKTLVYRFEIAWEESDLTSMIELKTGLADLMDQLNTQQNKAAKPTDEAAKRLKSQQKCQEQVALLSLNINDNAFGKKAEQVNKLFNDYIFLLEANLAEQTELLRK